MTSTFKGCAYVPKGVTNFKGMETADSNTISFKDKETLIHKVKDGIPQGAE